MSTSWTSSTSWSLSTAIVEADVADAYDLAALSVDDLLIEQVAHHAQHPLVAVIGRQLLGAQIDSVEADRAHLIVAHGHPGPAATNQEAVDAFRVDGWHQGGVAHPSDAMALDVEDLEANQFGQEQEVGGGAGERGIHEEIPVDYGPRSVIPA